MPDQKKYSTKLHGAHILIIGGTSGIGYAVAEACLEAGANVTISSSNPTRIQSAISSLVSSYPSASTTHRIWGTPVDLSNPDTLDGELCRLFDETVSHHEEVGERGNLDHVVFTAGDALSPVKIADLDVQHILRAGQIRFLAPLLISKYVARHVVRSYKSSYTITTGSVSEKPIRDWSVVASYAGGIHSMVRNLALDLRPVRVCGVSPGPVDTQLWGLEGEEKERVMSGFEGKLATGRVGRVEDVAESYMACLRDWNSDGGIVRTDGGGMVI